MESILKQYGVIFSTPPNYGLHNRIDTVNDRLSVFIEDHYSIYEANRLLDGINDIISENDSTGGPFDTQSLYVAVINNSVTKIYRDLDDYNNDSSMTPDYMLPTADFKVIVEAWRDYITNSPTTDG